MSVETETASDVLKLEDSYSLQQHEEQGEQPPVGGNPWSSAKKLPVTAIRRDGATQSRSTISESVVKDYAQELQDGAVFPPVEVVFDGENYWLWDGFHRLAATEEAGISFIMANIRRGTLDEARWSSYGANRTHGLRRSNEDKRLAVRMALLHPKGHTSSDREIARHVAVDHKTVSAVRQQLEMTGEIPQSDTRVGADGRVINTANIGSNQPEPVQPQETLTLPLEPEEEDAAFDGTLNGLVAPVQDEVKYDQEPVSDNDQDEEQEAEDGETDTDEVAEASYRPLQPSPIEVPLRAERVTPSSPAPDPRPVAASPVPASAPAQPQQQAITPAANSEAQMRQAAAASKFASAYTQYLQAEVGGLDKHTARLVARLVMLDYGRNRQSDPEAGLAAAQKWLRDKQMDDQVEATYYGDLPMGWIDSMVADIETARAHQAALEEDEREAAPNFEAVVQVAIKLFMECSLLLGGFSAPEMTGEIQTFARAIITETKKLELVAGQASTAGAPVAAQ